MYDLALFWAMLMYFVLLNGLLSSGTCSRRHMQGRRNRSRAREVQIPDDEEPIEVLAPKRRASQSRGRATVAKPVRRSKRIAKQDSDDSEDEELTVLKTSKLRTSSRSRSRSRTRAKIVESPKRPVSRSPSRRRAASIAESDENVDSGNKAELYSTPIKPKSRKRESQLKSDKKSATKKSGFAKSDAEDEEADENRDMILHVRSPPPPTPMTAKTLREKFLTQSLEVSPKIPKISMSTTKQTHIESQQVFAQLQSVLQVALIVLFYFVSSIGVVFLNKRLFIDQKYAPFTLTITILQMIGSVLFSLFLGSIAPLLAGISPAFVEFFPRVTIRSKILSQTLLTAFMFALTLAMNNICLQLVDISFYQVARAWTIICSLLLSYLFVKSEPFPSPRILFCCAIIVGGYVIAVIGKQGLALSDLKFELSEQFRTCYETSQSIAKTGLSPVCKNVGLLAQACAPRPRLLGLFFGFLGSLCLAAYSLLVRRDLKRLPVSNHVLATHANLSAAILITIFTIASGEASQFLKTFPTWEDKLHIVIAVLPVTIAGFLVGIATFLQISSTSALTHNVSGTAKASVQSILGWSLQNEQISPVTAVGTAVNVLGCMAYGAVSHAEKAKQPKQVTTPREWKEVEEIPHSRLAQKLGNFIYRFVNSPPDLPKEISH